MAITKLTQNADATSLEDSAQIKIICPICKTAKTLQFPKSVIIQAKGLTTMSIAKGLICDHHFQAFVDKHCAVRGYQQVDFEFENNKSKKGRNETENIKTDEKELFENLILEENYLEYRPKRTICDAHIQNNNYRLNAYTREKNQNKQNNAKNYRMPLQEIYNEFWEFIDDDNELFREFIIIDPRRKEKRYTEQL